MSNLLDSKICLVTGSTKGIGKAIASLFASEGATVIVNGKNPNDDISWINEHAYSDNLIPMFFDVSDQEAIYENVFNIYRKYNRIDVLVNNAGIEYNEPIGMISREKLFKMFDVNVYGAIEMIQAVSRLMARNNGGSIINISSMVGIYGNAGQLSYSATKGAINSITKSAAKELASKNIRVNSIAPGLTGTGMLDATSIDALRPRIENISLGRIADPLDIAGGCLLLATDYAKYITGQILPVDGLTIM